jgi:hypothetical protein
LKIEDALKEITKKDSKRAGREEMVYEYIINRQDEVFYYYSPDLKAAFPNIGKESLNWYLWNLAKKGKINKTKVGRYAYFGAKTAIAELIKKLPQDQKPKE